MPVSYVFNFFDAQGRKVASRFAETGGDVRAVVTAIKSLDDRPEYDVVEVAKDGQVLRRISRAEMFHYRRPKSIGTAPAAAIPAPKLETVAALGA